MHSDNIYLDLQNLAPVCVSVYSRVDHFKNCIESLLANELAKHTTIYIFSDGAKPGDEEAVSKVRAYARSITGFKDVKLIFQKNNDYSKNMKDLYQKGFEMNGKIILMEDDVIVQKFFLNFMNLALNVYEKKDKIFCINGYVGPENHLDESEDLQACHLAEGSGVGLWEKKYFDFLSHYKSNHPWIKLKKNISYLVKFIFNYGINLVLIYKKMYDNNLFYHDYILIEYLYQKKKIALMPPSTLTLNKGYDGSGLNCKISNEFNNEKFLRRLDKLNYPAEFSKKSAFYTTQRSLKYRRLKPNFVRQLYILIAYIYKPPEIIRNFFKQIGF